MLQQELTNYCYNDVNVSHRHTGQFFLQGLSHLCPKNFSTAPEKTATLTYKITLPASPHTEIISKNPGFQALYLTRQNEFRIFRLINTKKNFFFHFWLLASAQKN